MIKYSWQEFISKNLPLLVKEEKMLPQDAMRALAGWWKHYHKVFYYPMSIPRYPYGGTRLR